MIVLIVVFFTILTVTFVLAAFAAKPREGEKKVDERLAAAVAGDRRADSQPFLEASQLLKVSSGSHSGWLEKLLERFGLWQRLPIFMEQAAVSTTPESLLLLSVVFAAVGYGAMFFLVPILALEVAVAGIAGCLPVARIAWKRSRRLNAFNAGLPGAIDMMARALRAGHAMAAAIEMVSQDASAPVSTEFGEVFKQQNFGFPLREALTQMLNRVPSQDLRVLVTAILVQRETGGNLVEILDRTAFIIRERLRIYGEIRIQTAQGRLTGWILSLLPIVMLLLINLVNPGYSRILLTTPIGRKMIWAGAGLIAVGSFAIHRITNGVEV